MGWCCVLWWIVEFEIIICLKKKKQWHHKLLLLVLECFFIIFDNWNHWRKKVKWVCVSPMSRNSKKPSQCRSKRAVWCPQPCSITSQRVRMLRTAGHHRGGGSSLMQLLLSSVDTCAKPSDTEPGESLAQPYKLSWCFYQGENREVAKTTAKYLHECNRWWNFWQPDCFIPHQFQPQSDLCIENQWKYA